MADLWSFPEGTIGHSDSVKGYRLDASDGEVGTIEWADYAPGESYLVVNVGDGKHHLVPAGAITAVDHAGKSVKLNVTADEVRSTPQHENPETVYTEAKESYLDAFEIGTSLGRGAWPYLDIDRQAEYFPPEDAP